MSGKYQTYPAYKDSGVEWLGDVPEHWTVAELKRFSSVKGGYAFNSDSFVEDGEPVIRISDIKQDGSVSLENCKCVSDEIAKKYGEFSVNFGELVMAMTGATIGKAGWFKEKKPALVNQRVGVFKSNQKYLNYRFFWYVLSSHGYQEHIQITAFGGAQPNISDTGMVGYKTTIPIIEEQQKIAQFLDHETAKIDTLIEKQQRLIELLKEKRQAVISHVVTKGLNPNAPMKDSGVEWLGEVPESWAVTRAKFVSTIFVPQRNKPELNDEAGVAWATMEDMKGTYIEKTKNYVDGASAKIAGSKTLQAGAVIASCVGNFDVASINKIDVIINQQLQAFIPHSIKAEYLRETIGISKNYFELIGTAATLVYVNQQGFENLPVLVPTSDEQEKICEHIEKKCHEFQQLISFSEQAIELMQERRTALISAAVTGKIDVREWDAPNA